MKLPSSRFGTVPGRTAGDVGAAITALFGERGRIGTTAEQATAKLLWELGTEQEEMFTLHGVKLPGFNWDIDHLVIYRDLMVIIDDKAWRSNSDYYFTRRNTRSSEDIHVLRNGEEFSGNTLHPTYYQRVLAEFFPRKRILSIVVLHGHDQRLTWASPTAHIPILKPDELLAFLRRQFEVHGGRARAASKQFYLYGQLIPYTGERGQVSVPTDLMLLFKDQHSRRSAYRAQARLQGQHAGETSALRRIFTALGLVLLLGLGLPFAYVVAQGLIQLFSGSY
jgi:hypothetical protein